MSGNVAKLYVPARLPGSNAYRPPRAAAMPAPAWRLLPGYTFFRPEKRFGMPANCHQNETSRPTERFSLNWK